MEQYMLREDGMRRGVTTGTCAAAAAKAAAFLVLGQKAAEVEIRTPLGIPLRFPWELVSPGVCGVRKESGDDPDSTDGILICASVELTQDGEIQITGGEGVGRVTQPGLDQPPGAYAINTVPRDMIAAAVREALGPEQGALVTITIPKGEEAALRTCNTRLGIEGGLSILGTTGLVEPMSVEAVKETIRLELKVKKSLNSQAVLVAPGHYGETFAREKLSLENAVLCSNYIGDAVDMARELGFRNFLLVGHAGKLVKVAGGIFCTHSRMADARLEIITAHAALAGAERRTLFHLMKCVTVEAAFDLLDREGLLKFVTISLMKRIDYHLSRRGGPMRTGVILFTNHRGEMGRTESVSEMLTLLDPKFTENC